MSEQLKPVLGPEQATQDESMNFESIAFNESYILVKRGLWTTENDSVQVIGGFDDVIGRSLGSGTDDEHTKALFNTPGTVFQLEFALSVSPKIQTVVEIMKNTSLTPVERVKRLRQEQVLSGMKILDLGCSEYPNFAKVCHALGAEVHTADFHDIGQQEAITSHTDGDLNAPHAIDRLQHNTGGQFDVVTENIIAPLPRDPYTLKNMERITLLRIADRLLKSGGYCFANSDIYRKK